MKILKMFGLCTCIVPALILIGSLIIKEMFPLNHLITLTVMSAVPMFILVTVLKGILKLVKVVWR